MKKNYIIILSAAMLLLFTTSCKKGAVGPQGATGVQGAVGPAGANGQNGSVIYSGTTLPATTTGVTGDYYLDTNNGLLYGPKAASGWGTGFSMVGPTGATGGAGVTGATGATGSSVLNGTVIPAASLGNVGDFYLDIATYMLYGPKVASGWGPAVSLQGTPGSAANVEYSGWNIATNPKDSTMISTVISIGTIAAPVITQAFIDNSLIEVYMRYSSEVFPLPYTAYNGNSVYSTFDFSPKVGRIIVNRINNDDNSSFPAPFTSAYEFRYILIPGGTSLAIKQKLDLTNYEVVRKYFRLKN